MYLLSKVSLNICISIANKLEAVLILSALNSLYLGFKGAPECVWGGNKSRKKPPTPLISSYETFEVMFQASMDTHCQHTGGLQLSLFPHPFEIPLEAANRPQFPLPCQTMRHYDVGIISQS